MNEMSEQTANRLVMFFILGGIAFALVRKGNASTARTYKRIWGTTILGIAGAALAGFSPKIVGWFFALVIIAYITGNFTGLGSAVKDLQKGPKGVRGPTGSKSGGGNNAPNYDPGQLGPQGFNGPTGPMNGG